MPIQILQNVESGKLFTPCILCDKVMDECMPNSFETRQPYAGGEIQFLFGYGSTKFDDNANGTRFVGMICDNCAEKYVEKMDRLTENHREFPLPTSKILEDLFPLFSGTDNPTPDVLDNEPPSRNNEW